MKLCTACFFLLVIISCDACCQNSFFDSLISTTSLCQDEILLVTYQNPSTCVKCYIEPLEIINVIENNKGPRKVKYLALVRCDRELELKVFRRETGWKYFMYRDDGSAREKLKAPSKAIMSIIKFNGENLLNIGSGSINQNLKKIKEIWDKL